MQRIDQTSAVASRPTPLPAGVPGFFTNGDPANGSAPTIVDADFLNSLQEELMAFITAAAITPDKTLTNQVARSIQSGALTYGVDVGATNSLQATIPISPSAYKEGMEFRVKILHTNTGPCTLQINGLPATSVTKNNAALVGGELIAGQIISFKFDGSFFQVGGVGSSVNYYYTANSSSAGSANAQTIAAVTPSGYILQFGDYVSFTAGITNSAAMTMNVAATGALAVKKVSGTSLVDVASGDITNGNQYILFYNGTNYQLFNNSLPAASNFLQVVNNLSDVLNAATARGNIGAAPLNSPDFAGTPQAITPSAGDNSRKLATTEYVDNLSRFKKITKVIIRSTATWVPPAGFLYAEGSYTGGGGGGAGAASGQKNCGGGGGAGGYGEIVLDAATVGAGILITIGAGGAGGASGANNGSAGGTTTIGAVGTATGGGGGKARSTPFGNSRMAIGGVGGTCVGGWAGSAGGSGIGGDDGSGVTCTGGVGAPGYKGLGAGLPVMVDGSTGGAGADNTGAGGAGAVAQNASAAGGAGGSGVVVLNVFTSQ